MRTILFAAIATAMLLAAGSITGMTNPAYAAESCNDFSGKKLKKCIDNQASAACEKAKGQRNKAKCFKTERAKLMSKQYKSVKAKKKTQKKAN